MLAVRVLLITLFAAVTAFAQMPPVPIGPGVSQELAKWRSVQYSNISYKLNLTLEKMSPVLKGHMEIHVTQAASACAEPNCPPLYLILDWRKLPGHEKDSTVNNVTLNEIPLFNGDQQPAGVNASAAFTYHEINDHLVLAQGVKMGENVITLDFTSPILTSGSAITRYIDKEDGSEYIYSLFVPSDASTVFPVFDQPDLKARFTLTLKSQFTAGRWQSLISNAAYAKGGIYADPLHQLEERKTWQVAEFEETKPISTYVFAFAAGPWTQLSVPPAVAGGSRAASTAAGQSSQPSVTPSPSSAQYPPATAGGTDTRAAASPVDGIETHIYVRKSQAAKFQPHAAETFRLTREAIKYLETYFDYKFPWPKYDLVLIPEFPFGGMEHAGATFLKESSVIFPTEPTKGDYISRANLIFHETAHQWFGDLVTMRWFDDLWLKEGFAEFMGYKTLEHVMPDANAWKVFYERNKQAAYATDSTRGTTPIYQKIDNLSAAKSAYGNIVYRKAPSFLRQAEFYLGEDKFQTAVRAFLKKHEYANAGWEDLVGEFEAAKGEDLQQWANQWVRLAGLPEFRVVVTHDTQGIGHFATILLDQLNAPQPQPPRIGNLRFYFRRGIPRGKDEVQTVDALMAVADRGQFQYRLGVGANEELFVFPNYGDYGYGIFLLDEKSRDYVLKHIGEEKDPFLRSMMWGALWDSVREAELDPREYVELVIKQLGGSTTPAAKPATTPNQGGESDETTIASLLGRVSTALNYYVDAATRERLAPQFEGILLDRMQHAQTPGQRITFYRAFVSNATTGHGRTVLKQMLAQASGPQKNHPVGETPTPLLRKEGSTEASTLPTLRTKDKFDIVTRLIVLGDPDAPRLLAELETTETSDDAKRYAYAAHAAFATAENRAKSWNDFVNNKDISESWIEGAIGPFNSIRHPELSQPYLERALTELPNLKRTRKIFFINNWLSAWLGGQRDEKSLAIVNKFLADNPNLDNDLRLKVLENVDLIERAVKIRARWDHRGKP